MDKKKELRVFLYVLATILFTVSCVLIFFKFDIFIASVKFVASAFTPLISGLILAFVINVILNMFENLVFSPINKKCKPDGVWVKLRRPVSIICSYIFVISIIALMLIFIIPELFLSIETLFNTALKNVPEYTKQLLDFANKVVIDYNLDIDTATIQTAFTQAFDLTSTFNNLSKTTTNILNSVVSTTYLFANGIFNGVLSLIFSVYFLASKEKLIKSVKKLLYSYSPRKIANRISMFLTVCNRIFSGYVKGQLTECLILGSLCYIGMLIIGLDYALLISSIVAVFALVPLVGAFVGAITGAFFLFIANPIDAVWFLLFFLILQQFEGNVIFPKVVGSSIGLPGVWTLAAVAVMGGLFGIFGILIGTPTAGVIYTLLRRDTRQRLKLHEIDDNVLMGSEVAVIYSDILTPKETISKTQTDKKSKITFPKQVKNITKKSK